jgi:superfamily II DNA or RNA helicase
MSQDPPVHIRFDRGTLLVEASPDQVLPIIGFLKYDERVRCYRVPGYQYAPLVRTLLDKNIPYEDEARDFLPLELNMQAGFAPRPHQAAAMHGWLETDGRGLVIMPTGSGKTYMAAMAIARIRRPTLVVVPTIDLMQQWSSVLERLFGCPAGMLGGGSREILPLTVTTYDSAVLNMEFIGNRFGFIIFDECHHLPGPMNRLAAQMAIAPWRLGLTATPEREDDGEELLYDLIGPQAYRIDIDQLEGDVLAPYRTVRLELPLDDDEQREYSRASALYKDFLKSSGITFEQKSDWSRFIGLCARSEAGRRAFEAYLSQRRIARAGRNKFRKTWELIVEHRGERIIIFTADNETAYRLGEEFLLPVITHRTKAAERKEMLDLFRSGDYPVLVTSKVLNEGVDVPEAGIGIVLSGSASIREHVQRLGRILRAGEGKKAVLYELVSLGTSEMSVSRRRREHRAYRRSWRKY